MSTPEPRGVYVGACPDCGAEPGCNIDCRTCLVWDSLTSRQQWELVDVIEVEIIDDPKEHEP